MSTPPVHTLYRFFDRSGALLYVGRTIDARSRFRSHERAKEWFDQVARLEREVFPSAEALAHAEITAIRNEEPLYNVQHSTRPRPRLVPTVEIDDEDDPRVLRRLASREAYAEDEFPEPPCGRAEVGSGCDCPECVRCHLAEIDRMREQHDEDAPLVAVFDRLEQDYLNGADSIDWLYDIDDAQMFRRFRLRARSKDVPAPALTTLAGNIAQVGCPFCSHLHEHFFAHGSAITALSAPCLGGGEYRPVFEYDEFCDETHVWHQAVAA